MATSIPPHTWRNGFRQPAASSQSKDSPDVLANGTSNYVSPPSLELPTSTINNSLGSNLVRTWPTIYNGTQSPHGLPSWWNPSSEVDVLIIGGTYSQRQDSRGSTRLIGKIGGPTGLETALSLTRQRITFRILGQSSLPCRISSVRQS